MTRLRLQLLITLLVAAATVGAFFLAVPTTVANTAPLERLVIAMPPINSVSPTPSFSGDLPTAQLPYAAIVSDAVAHPDVVGAWGKEWFGSNLHNASDAIDVQVQAIAASSSAVAVKVESEVVSASMSKRAVVAAKNKYVRTVPLASIAGSATEYIIPAVRRAKTQTAPAFYSPPQNGVYAVGRTGRTTLYISLKGSIATVATAEKLGQQEKALVDAQIGSIPPLQSTTYPPGSTLATVLVGAGALIVGIVSPLLVEMGRRRRAAELAARADRHRRVRGSKALKSHRRRY